MRSRCGLIALMALAAAGIASGDAPRDRHRSGAEGGDVESRVARRLQKADRLIRWFDSNQDGVIEPNEIHGQGRYVYERMAKEAGLDPTRSLSVAELRTAMTRYFQKLEEGGGKSAGSRNSGTSSMDGRSRHDHSARDATTESEKSSPKVGGFGVPAETPKVAGFGQPATTASPSSVAGSSGGHTGSATPGPSSNPAEKNEMDDRVRRYAESLLRRYDTNKNGVLEKDEWSKMRGSPEQSDRNHDGVITLEELTIRLSEYGRHGSSSWSSSSSSTGSSGTSRSTSSTSSDSYRSGDRKSYRFLTPTERLPKDLPDWFARKDADGDGQVSMAEFSSVWDEAKAAEFSGYDLNNDGVITPAECLEKAKSK